MTNLKAFIDAIPKCELHLHLEGTLEPEHLLDLARKYNVPLEYTTADEVRQAYAFENLESFLTLYCKGCDVLRAQEDFYDLTMRYLRRAKQDNVHHVEVFCDPQSHTTRGVAFEAVLDGITQALHVGETEFGISSHVIVSFLRHLSADEAMETLDAILEYRDGRAHGDKGHRIKGVGLDSAELGNEPLKFQKVFAKAHQAGLLACSHAGEEGPPSYIWSALDHLNVHRIDHGVRCLEDEKLVSHLVERKMPLTVCPFSNLKLAVVADLTQHPLRKMLDAGLAASIHSDDPAYFGGYIGENYHVTAQALDLDATHIVQLARNAIEACFLEEAQKQVLHDKLQACCDLHLSSLALSL